MEVRSFCHEQNHEPTHRGHREKVNTGLFTEGWNNATRRCRPSMGVQTVTYARSEQTTRIAVKSKLTGNMNRTDTLPLAADLVMTELG